LSWEEEGDFRLGGDGGESGHRGNSAPRLGKELRSIGVRFAALKRKNGLLRARSSSEQTFGNVKVWPPRAGSIPGKKKHYEGERFFPG